MIHSIRTALGLAFMCVGAVIIPNDIKERLSRRITQNVIAQDLARVAKKMEAQR